MEANALSAEDIAGLLQTQGPCTRPLDATANYLRRRLNIILPIYLLAMMPHAFIISKLIVAIVGGERSEIQTDCIYLVPATLWRWMGISVLQNKILRDLQIPSQFTLWRKMLSILELRLLSSVAISWGSLLAGVPAFYALYTGSFSMPLLTENPERITRRVGLAISWVHHSAQRQFGILFVLTILACWLVIVAFVGQMVLGGTIFPSLMGINTTDFNVTIQGWPWRLGVFYSIFLILDLFWSAASVFLYYDCQSRRMASDLRARMVVLAEGSA